MLDSLDSRLQLREAMPFALVSFARSIDPAPDINFEGSAEGCGYVEPHPAGSMSRVVL